MKDVMPLYTVFTVDGLSLPKLQKAGFATSSRPKNANSALPCSHNDSCHSNAHTIR